MSKIDMNYANYLINKKDKLHPSENPMTKSNKNLLSDLLHEVADAMDFDMTLLQEDNVKNKPYLFEESDIELLAEMATQAKSSEGKRIRCKDFTLEYADTVEYFITAFLELAKHNNVSDEVLFEAEFKMYARTDFVVMKRDVGILTDEFDVDLERHFFAPTDYLPDEDDELTKSDKLMFLVFMCQNPDIDAKTMRGIYWCFVEERQSRNRDKSIKQLRELSQEEKKKLVEGAVHQVKFENRLHEDDEYVETITEFVKIESGGGKLQDRKKVIPLAKKLCEIMDRNADDFMTTEEYAKGEPDFKKARPKEENIRENISESREALNDAISYYNSFRAYRSNHPLTSDDERMIEVFFKQRFDEDMF